MNYTNIIFFTNLPRIRVINIDSVEKGEKMKIRNILIVGVLILLTAKAFSDVENSEPVVDNADIFRIKLC